MGLFSCFGDRPTPDRQERTVSLPVHGPGDSTAGQRSSPQTLSRLLAALSEVHGATWLGRLHRCAQLTAETGRATVRIYAYTGDCSQYVLLAARGPDGAELLAEAPAPHLRDPACIALAADLNTPTSITLAGRSRAPLLHTDLEPYTGGPLPPDWAELRASSDARAFATAPLISGGKALGAVLLSSPTGHAASASGCALPSLSGQALHALSLALSLYCLGEGGESVAWLAGVHGALLECASFQQAMQVLCGGVTAFVEMRFMLQATVQAALLAEPGSGIACMVHGSTPTAAAAPGESGRSAPPAPLSAPQSLRGRTVSSRSNMSGVRRILAETAGALEGAAAGAAAARQGAIGSRLASTGDSLPPQQQQPQSPLPQALRRSMDLSPTAAVAASAGPAATDFLDGRRVSSTARSHQGYSNAESTGGNRSATGMLRARTFKLQATLFRALVEGGEGGGGSPRGLVVDDCARHVQDVHKPTRDVAMLIQSTAARCLVLTGATLSNGATLGLYVCFPCRLPLPLLTAVHSAVHELLAEALRAPLDTKLCGDLRHEFEVLKAGVPGVYLATTTASGAASPAPRSSHTGGGGSGGAGGGGDGSLARPDSPRLLERGGGGLAAPRAASSSQAAVAVAATARISQQPHLPGGSVRGGMKSPLAHGGGGGGGGRGSRRSSGSSAAAQALGSGGAAIAAAGPAVGEEGALSNAHASTGAAAPAARVLLQGLGGSSRGGHMGAGMLAQVSKLNIDDALLVSSGGDCSALMDSLMSLGQLNCGSPSIGATGGALAAAVRASSVIRVQELDGSTAIRNQMAVLVSSFQASLADTQLERLMAGRASAVPDDLDQLQLVSLLGRGGAGVVLRGLLAQVAVAVKLIGMPDPEPRDAAPSLGQQQQQQQQQQQAPPRAAWPSAAGGVAPRGPQQPPPQPEADEERDSQPAAAAVDITASEALSRRRELTRGAMEMAVLTSTSHPCLVQVFSYYTNLVLEESGTGPGGNEIFSLRRCNSQDEALRLQQTPPPMVFTAVCMEWCDQGSLHDAIASGRFLRVADQQAPEPTYVIDLEAVYLTLLEVAMALRYLHARRILHRDVKPGNVLLKSAAQPVAAEGDTRGFNSKLADFGFALQMDCVEGDRAFVVPDQACGSLPYMAPETFRSGSRLDGSTDVYSFGVVMWEAVSGGQLPYNDIPHKDIPREVYRGRRPPFRPEIPHSYRSLAQACWAAQPSKRPTAAQLVSALKHNLSALTQQQPQQQQQQPQQQQQQQQQPQQQPQPHPHQKQQHRC